MSKLRIEKILVVRTSHITKDDNEMLLARVARDGGCAYLVEGDPLAGVLTVLVDPLAYKGADDAEFSEMNEGLSADFKHLVALAVSNDCRWLRLDPDVEGSPDLPSYDW